MDAARDLFDQFVDQGLSLLNRWVAEGVREDLHLDFKRKAHPREVRLSDEDRKNYSKALSGFANSDSGIIIWGIGAPGSGNSERTKHPIHYVRGFAEYLDSYISRLVSPSVEGAENLVIFEDERRDLGYVVSYIPKSSRAPHRAESEGLKHYYMRYGESFKIAEHFELEFIFGKRNIPEIGVFWGVEVEHVEADTSNGNHYDCLLRIGVTNQGKAIAKYVCLRMRYDSISFYQVDQDLKSDLIHYSRPHKASRENFYSITARALQGMVIYPGDYTNFFSFRFSCTDKDLMNQNMPIFESYYDLFGEDYQGKTKEAFVVQGKKITEKLRKRIDQI
ncbi:AlbA family DNA-binding domain-containing protein [Pseudobacteriovorax antillogorgiicola]|uniref:Putative DNA-binding domain-containing protein n=1 Tax=Pseudobacteriovorax antillogorgiicola TaxID=1513793 RepID=A0A1Y6C765_9BACT|nr:ATP-binding protein [Pseudobacteriovorax antillogorgiicola]TCS50705.1 putative DNA-binding protein [Pseudobacteriovorax antillogorgiicola]SMF40556.1 Putative DNA-binding domain-containing protein [Pseudobacteriovorax antillogorgiicola]